MPHFREQRQGTIINIASVGGRITFPLYSLYHATKWAIKGLTESMQYQLAPFNVRVKIVEPGPIKTDFYDRSLDVINKPGLTAYDAYTQRVMPNMMPNIKNAGATAPGPEVVAKVEFRAATDGCGRLRYSANSAMFLFLRKLFPDYVFFWVMRKALKA